MALISIGSLERFVANAVHPNELESAGEASLSTSDTPRGLALSQIRLDESFDNVLTRLFKPKHEIYFVVWAWDFSGAPPVSCPGLRAEPTSVLIPMRAGSVREFIGAGTLLFPARKVVGGVAVRIMFSESSRGVRGFAEKLAKVTDTIKHSPLANALTAFGLAANVTTVALSLVKDAALELGNAVGNALREVGDDSVDLYEGFYPVEHEWAAGDENHNGEASSIKLTRF